jgi:AcrR family transcriptional regulator
LVKRLKLEEHPVAYVKASKRSEQLVAAARQVLTREGVVGTTLRAVAAEAEVPLGTLHYVFPSKELLLKAVIEDVVEEIAGVLHDAADLDNGLDRAIRGGLERFWAQLVESDPGLQLMQYELTTYSLRTKGLERLARWQYERYCRIVAAWCQEAANNAGELCAVPFDTLGRVLVASMDGIILQHVCDPDAARSRRDLEAIIEMITHLAGTRDARSVQVHKELSA